MKPAHGGQRAHQSVPRPRGALRPIRDHDPGAVGVTLLGGFGIDVAGREVFLPAAAQRIVALLALRGRVGRSRLAGTLWPDTPEHRARGSLRTGIWRVNLAVPNLVLTAAGQVELASRADVDTKSLVAESINLLARDAPSVLTPDVFPLGACLQDNDLLPDWDDEWLTDERERLHQLRLHLLEWAAEHLAARGEFGLAVEMGLRALRGDALRESAHRALVRIHLAEGNLHEAHRAYRLCAQILQRELGITPSPAMAGMLRDHGIPVDDDRARETLPHLTRIPE